MDWLSIESPAYWLMFTLAFLAVAQWESGHSERPLIVPIRRRWTCHGAILLVGGIFLITIVRLSPVAIALIAREHTWGLFRQRFFLEGPGYWIAVVATLLLLDLTRYGTHRCLHAFEWLWRIHHVHHSDSDFDVSTSARFHPLEALLVQGTNVAVIWLVAPPLAGVVISDVLAAGINFVEHANAAFPEAWERRLRAWIITPSLHRIHHSEHVADQQKNLGQLFPWWDRLLGTYAEESLAGSKFALGLTGYQNSESVGLGEMLLEPVRVGKQNADSARVGDAGISEKL